MTAAGQALRRRIILAVILLAAFIVLLRVAVLAGEFDTVSTAATFEAARENRTALRAFLHRMPKGGDLHTHLAGAVYAERFIAWAAQQELCVDPQKVVVAKLQCDRAGAVPVSDAMRDQKLYNRLVDALSMRAFLPTPAVPTGHDEFFAAFDKFGAVSSSHFVDMTIDQLRRYDSENVQYVEFMVSSWCADDRDRNALRRCAQGFTLSNRPWGPIEPQRIFGALSNRLRSRARRTPLAEACGAGCSRLAP